MKLLFFSDFINEEKSTYADKAKIAFAKMKKAKSDKHKKKIMTDLDKSHISKEERK